MNAVVSGIGTSNVTEPISDTMCRILSSFSCRWDLRYNVKGN